MMEKTRVRPGLRYAAGDEIAPLLASHAGHVLGCVGFGAGVALDVRDIPFASTGMPVLGAGHAYEVWMSPEPVRTDCRGRIATANNDQVLFGCLQIPAVANVDYDALVYEEYGKIFDLIDAAGYPNLLRAWHYLPDIHREERSLERYKRFSLGRHEAFVSRGRAISRDAPAASAVGTGAGDTVIAFLAGLRPGTPIENPRQVSAYSYPAQYGPRGPTFSRALFTTWNGCAQLYVSGTASIFGHLSRHEGDAAAQADETVLNLRSVIGEAKGLIEADAASDLTFKVYLRNPSYRPLVEARLRAAFGPSPRVIWLQADICRRELLLEIELVVIDSRPR
jgi:chorismate lyase/3-hydroxybenzoate synthase